MIANLVRNARPRLLALLAAPDGDLAAAEDAFSDAVEKALREWPTTGVPANPEAWLFTVARNRRRDGWRGAARTTCLDDEVTTPGLARDRGGISGVPTARTGTVEDAALEIPDRRMTLLAVAAHPAIDPVARTPLLLNTVLGLSAGRIGALLLVPTATMAARLTRAKKRIKSSDLRFEQPGVDELPGRLEAIRDAIYGAYSVDWMHSATTHRDGLADEALFLAELLTDLVPDDPESHGLAALLCLSAARRRSRIDKRGEFVPLDRQDTTTWDHALLHRGEEHLRAAGTSTSPGPYRLQAAIQAVHCARRRTGTTDWEAIRRLHSGLQESWPSTGGAVALAVATARCDGPEAGLAILDRIGDRAERFQPAVAARAALLAEVGRPGQAVEAYARAIVLTTEPTARRHLEAIRARLASATAATPLPHPCDRADPRESADRSPRNAPGAELDRSTDVRTAHEHAGRYGCCHSLDHIVQSLRRPVPSRGRP